MVTTYRDLHELASAQRRRISNIKLGMRIAEESQIGDTVTEARRLLSGTVTTAQLAHMDHPFARRHGGALIPTLPINAQTRQLLNSLSVVRRNTESTMIFQIRFRANHARFVLAPQGTRFMVPRGFWDALVRFTTPLARKRYLNALRRSERL